MVVINNIFRRLPNSYLSRKSTLVNALGKVVSLPPAGNILTDFTTEKLTEITPVYVGLMTNVNAAQAALSSYTPVKNAAFEDCKGKCTNMFDGINLAVNMKILTPGDRAFYGMEIESGNMLPMSSENDLKEAVMLLVEGETKRIADGGTALSMPTLAYITAAQDNYINKLDIYNNLIQSLNVAKGHLAIKAVEVDNFIKILWAEIEARYAAEPIDSRRAKARLWGVVYASTTHKVPVTVNVVSKDTNEAVANAMAGLAEADIEETADADGKLTLRTDIIGPDTMTVTAEGFVTKVINIDTTDDKPINMMVQLDRVIIEPVDSGQ